MITKEQLQAMSDHTLNHVIYHSLFVAGFKVAEECPDYCNTPNDIMPLAFEHRISLIENDDGYTAYHKFSIYEDINYRIEHGAYFGDANPLRAITCCLILALQEKQK